MSAETQAIRIELAKLRPEQVRHLHEQCLGTGPFKVLSVTPFLHGTSAEVDVLFQDGEKKTVTV